MKVPTWRSDGARLSLLAVAWLVFILAVYCPDVGRGFVKDDFTWIRTAKTAITYPSTLILQREIGFYRPVVTLTFVADYLLHGWRPRGYGWTNLALYGLCAAALIGLARAMRLSWWAAVLSAFLWAINPHGINMAVLWLSGRTALCLTLFALLAAIAFLRRWYGTAAVLIALALASKEEAVVLPAILLVWAWLSMESRPPWRAFAATCLPLGAYLTIRSFTSALTPATAPSFYQFTTDAFLVVRNIAEYFDRTTTLLIAVVGIAMLVYRKRPASDTDRRILAMMGTWWIGMFAITVWLPVRSSLYAVCPSIATAVIAAMILERMREGATNGAHRLEPLLAMALLAAVPVYQMRNDRLVEAARVSERALRTIRADQPSLPQTGSVVFQDDPDVPSFRFAFGDLAAEAMQTAFNSNWGARIETYGVSPPAAATQGQVAVEYRIDHGRISRITNHGTRSLVPLQRRKQSFEVSPENLLPRVRRRADGVQRGGLLSWTCRTHPRGKYEESLPKSSRSGPTTASACRNTSASVRPTYFIHAFELEVSSRTLEQRSATISASRRRPAPKCGMMIGTVG